MQPGETPRAGGAGAEPSVAWLTELTSVPTAAGRERRVVEWIRAWVAERESLSLSEDDAGNLVVSQRCADAVSGDRAPLFITAHLDHPAFVVLGAPEGSRVELAFRGGVRDAYFDDAPIEIIPADHGTGARGGTVGATVVSAGAPGPDRLCVAELDTGADGSELRAGDIARWSLPEAEIDPSGTLRTHACDDLAAACAALGAMERLAAHGESGHVKLLFTLAEEVGFIGAIAACKLGTMRAGSRVLALENSRSFAESPIGGGPIVRVGDRMSTFTPWLTNAVVESAKRLSGGAERGPSFRYQRRLMPGGACEATAFMAYGYDATCVCLPLGNYHNMADLDAVLAGDDAAVANARCGREYISIDDYAWMVDLLVECGSGALEAGDATGKLDGLYDSRRDLLGL